MGGGEKGLFCPSGHPWKLQHERWVYGSLISARKPEILRGTLSKQKVLSQVISNKTHQPDCDELLVRTMTTSAHILSRKRRGQQSLGCALATTFVVKYETRRTRVEPGVWWSSLTMQRRHSRPSTRRERGCQI